MIAARLGFLCEQVVVDRTAVVPYAGAELPPLGTDYLDEILQFTRAEGEEIDQMMEEAERANL